MPTPPSIPNRPLTVAEVYESCEKSFQFELLAGGEGMQSTIETSEINRPGLALAGFYEMFSSDRLQLIGLTECAFLRNLEPAAREEAIRKTLGFSIPAVILTSSETPAPELITVCNDRNIPLLRTSALTSTIASSLHRFQGTWTQPELRRPVEWTRQRHRHPPPTQSELLLPVPNKTRGGSPCLLLLLARRFVAPSRHTALRSATPARTVD